MGERVKESVSIKDAIRAPFPGNAERADADHGAPYRLARAHVIEASLRGLVRLRVA